MYTFLSDGFSRAPLDFNLPRRTDTVADALGPDPSSRRQPSVSDLDTGALLADVGLPDFAVRSIVTSRPAPEV